MKKFRVILFVVILMLTALCLTSCSGSNIDKAFISTEPKGGKDIANVTEVEGLTGDIQTVSGDLVYFRSYEDMYGHHIVYNLKINSIIHNIKSKNASMHIGTLTVEGEEIGFLVSINYEASESVLYTADGDIVAVLDECTNFEYEADIIRFGDKCYRAYKSGKIRYAFDYPSVSHFPESLTKYGNHYYQYLNNVLYVYDEELGCVSQYSVPSYAENPFYTVLENGNALIQYTYPADATSDDYDVMLNGEKHILVTDILKIKSGKVTHTECNYMLRYANNLLMDPKRSEENGIDPTVFPVMGEAYRINDKQLDKTSSLLIYITNSGKVKEFDKVNGSSITSVELLDTNRYIIGTKSHRYLMDEKGNILGDITNSQVYGKYLVNSNDGKIYDSDMTLLYNYGEKSYSINSVLGDNIILYSHLTGQSNAIFSGSSNLKNHIPENKVLTAQYKNFYICKNENQDYTYYVYDQNGNEIYTFSLQTRRYYLDTAAKTDYAFLLRAYSPYEVNHYYLVSYE